MLFVTFFEERADGVLKNIANAAHLQKAGTDRNVHAGSDKQKQHHRSPGKTVQNTVDFDDQIHKKELLFTPGASPGDWGYMNAPIVTL